MGRGSTSVSMSGPTASRTAQSGVEGANITSGWQDETLDEQRAKYEKLGLEHFRYAEYDELRHRRLFAWLLK
jgi:hypothetical protein